MTVLFLCTGNTCRSPMAEALFLARFACPGADRIISAGTFARPGCPAEPDAVAAAYALGADLRAHQSQQATPALLNQADVIVCLSANHARQISAHVPQAKIRVLGGGVPDPYGGGLDRYHACAAQIAAALPALHSELRCTAQIIPAKAAHLPALAQLERMAFTPPASESTLRAKFELEHNHMLVAMMPVGAACQPPGINENTLAGFIGVDEIAGEAFVDDLAVFPEYRRQGIASSLLSRAQAGAILRGCEKIHLEVRESNAAARALYEAQGYREVGRRKNYYESPREDAILMTLKIN